MYIQLSLMTCAHEGFDIPPVRLAFILYFYNEHVGIRPNAWWGVLVWLQPLVISMGFFRYSQQTLTNPIVLDYLCYNLDV